MSDTNLTLFDDGQVVRKLGFLPSDPARMRARPSWTEAGNPIVPESQWEAFDFWPEEVLIKNQGQFGACNGHATASELEIARWIAGHDHVPLSAWWVYGNLTGGRDIGSNPMEALALITSTGCAPESEMPWGKFNPRNFSAQATADAPRFKAELGSAITTPAEMMSAVQLRRPMDVTVCVGRQFNNLDAYGVAPANRGTDDHAVMMFGGAKQTSSGAWLLKIANSWDVTWGDKGFFWEPLSYFFRNNGYEYNTVSAATDDPQDKTNPPTFLV